MNSTTVAITQYLDRRKPVLNTVALGYTLLGYGGAIALLFPANLWLNILGVVLLTHTLVLSAYFAHDFMHGSVFADRQWNVFWGNVMLWLNGGCYARFDDLMKIHIAHHVNRVDFHPFDLAEYVQNLPAIVRLPMLALESLYFPALAFLVRWRSITAPFWMESRRNERLRTTVIFLVRGSLFCLMAIASPRALILYFLAYIGMLHVLRFIDTFQHTYEVFPVGSPIPKRSHAHEQANTFSNIFSRRYAWLNLLLLNFGYHNAHHELMKCPWYNLPELDNTLYTGAETHYVPCLQLLKNYHRFRVSRIFSGQGAAVNAKGQQDLEQFYGAIEVSLLVLPA